MTRHFPQRRADENKILAALDAWGSHPFAPHMERVTLHQGDVLYEPDSRIEHVYFPETAVCSMLATMEDGSTVEVGPVGDEGMAGLGVFFGGCVSPTRLIVHVAGAAVRLRADVLRAGLDSGAGPMRLLLLRYTQMLLAMTCQTAACYKLHPMAGQFARWLLMMHDYVRQDELRLTHELMALTLGTRRAGVSVAAGVLKDAGLIKYRRGHIRIIDREGLKATTCECYPVIKGEYDRLYADLAELGKRRDP